MTNMTPKQARQALKLADFAVNSQGSTQREIELARLALHLSEKLEQANTVKGSWQRVAERLEVQIIAEKAAREQAEARLAKVHEALRKEVVSTIRVGWPGCYLCDRAWPEGQPENHAPGCAADLKGEP